MGHGGCRHTHIAADYHGACFGIDHHAGRGLAWHDIDVFHHAHEGHTLCQIYRGLQCNGHAIEGARHVVAKSAVDGIHNGVGGGEVAFTHV